MTTASRSRNRRRRVDEGAGRRCLSLSKGGLTHPERGPRASERVTSSWRGAGGQAPKITVQGEPVTPFFEFNLLTTCTRIRSRRNRADVARLERTPRTGEPVAIAASNVPSFNAGKVLRDAVH